MIAARAVGLNCGPMSGFDIAKVNAEFFPDGRHSANFLISLRYGDDSKLFNRTRTFPSSRRGRFSESVPVIRPGLQRAG